MLTDSFASLSKFAADYGVRLDKSAPNVEYLFRPSNYRLELKAILAVGHDF